MMKRRRRRRRVLKIGVEIAMAKKDSRKERRQELRALSLAAAHPHLWMQEIIQRVFVDGKIIQRLFVDAGSHPKVISGWRKAWKGYV